MNKLISDPHYHVWTDALHLRQLARDTTDKWDRGTYVRTTIILAWTAFETALADLLRIKRLGGKFRDNLDAAISGAGIPPRDWGKGVWQAVALLNGQRVDYVHRTAGGVDLFPPVEIADDALETIRNALVDIHSAAGVPAPPWLADDADRGWMGRTVARDYAHGAVIHPGVDRNAEDTLRVTYVDHSGEHTHAYCAATADAHQLASDLLGALRVPVSNIRIYRGGAIELDWELNMRGAP